MLEYLSPIAPFPGERYFGVYGGDNLQVYNMLYGYGTNTTKDSIISISSFFTHELFLYNNGKVCCEGSNVYKQLFNEDITLQHGEYVPIPLPLKAVKVLAVSRRSYILLEDGSVMDSNEVRVYGIKDITITKEQVVFITFDGQLYYPATNTYHHFPHYISTCSLDSILTPEGEMYNFDGVLQASCVERVWGNGIYTRRDGVVLNKYHEELWSGKIKDMSTHGNGVVIWSVDGSSHLLL